MDPVRAATAAMAALRSGLALSFKDAPSIVGALVRGRIVRMLGYLVTVLAVAGFVGRSHSPAADGMPYIEE